MKLSDLPAFTPASVTGVEDASANDTISRRLRELGFVDGEPVRGGRARPLRRRTAAGPDRLHPLRPAPRPRPTVYPWRS
ncbi:MAG: ferrous iron transport protein A [Asticcacaulis sp.]